MATLRKILFYVFLGIYLVLCPLIILYSLGYIYAPKAEDRLVKTGLIRLETIPSGASVYLSNKRFSEKTPCTLGELLPGRYKVRIRLRGHRPWEREVYVEAGKAAVYDKILLLNQKLQQTVLLPQSFQVLAPVPDTRFLLLLESKKLGDVVVFDWKSETSRRLLAGRSPYLQQKILRYFMVKESPFVLFEVSDGTHERYFWCGLRENDLGMQDVTELFKQGKPDDVRWEGEDPEYLFTDHGDSVSRLDLDKMIVTPGFMKDLRGFGLYKEKVYGLKEDALVRLNFGAKGNNETLVDSGRLLRDIFREKRPVRLDFLNGGTVFFVGENGQLITNQLPYQFIRKGLIGYIPDENAEKALVWTHEKLGLFDLEAEAPDESLFERGPEIVWFLKKGSDIDQAYFVYDASHALFCDGASVRLSEIGLPSSTLEVQDIVKVREGSLPFYTEKTGKLYYLEPQQGQVASLAIIPEGKMIERMIEEIGKKEEQGKP